jgi:acyl-CoA dehydrogenase
LERWAERNRTPGRTTRRTWTQTAGAGAPLLGAAAGCGTRCRRPYGGRAERLDVRTHLRDPRDAGVHAGLADFAFAMQGLGSGRDSLFGSGGVAEARYLPPTSRAGERSPRSLSRSSTPAATSPPCRRPHGATATAYVIDGEKTWISNGGIADHYVVFCRTRRAARSGFSARGGCRTRACALPSESG